MEISKNLIATIAICNVIMLTLDAIWISLNYQSYKLHTESIQQKVMNVRVGPAVAAYVLLGVGLSLCILQTDMTKPWWHSTLYGALWGFVIYGVYNATNMAILSDYQLWIGVKDSVWGMTLLAATVTAGYFIRKSLIRRSQS